MKKISVIILAILISFNANAGTDGENILSKNRAEKIDDCFVGVNKSIFAFNQGLDKAIFKPVASAYRKLPTKIRKGAGNVLNNLSNLLTIPNNIFQGEIGLAGSNSARLLVNSTVGVLGIFDVASNMGLDANDKEDYGQILATWGVGPGCYIVLPIMGPSTLRDVVGTFGSMGGGLDPWYNITVKKDTQHFTDFDYYTSRVGNALDFRAKNIDSFENLEKNSMDFYASVKSLYLQDRSQKILNTKKSITTQNDSDWEEIESN